MPRHVSVVPYNRFMLSLQTRISVGRSEATVTKIMSNLRTIHELITHTRTPFNDLDFLNDYTKVQTEMKSYTLRSYKTYIASAVSALSLYPEKKDICELYRVHHTSLKASVDTEDDSNIKTAKQEEKMCPFSDLVKARDAMKEKISPYLSPCTIKQYQDVQSYMVLCMATMCDTVLRNQELCKMVVCKTWDKNVSKDRNYFLCEYGIMELYVYKTFSTYGKMVIPLSSELNEILLDCLSMSPYPFKEGHPFLVNQNGSALTLGGGIQRLYEKAGLSVCPTIVRNIIATERSAEELESLKQLQQNAKDFGHSVEQHVRYVRKSLTPDPATA